MNIYTHSADLDGVVSGMHLAWLTGADPDQVVYLDYGQEAKITRFPCLMADLNLADDHPALADSRNVIIDHHQDRRGKVEAQVVYEEGKCAALMVADNWRLWARGTKGLYIEDKYPERALRRWSHLAQVSDYMLEADREFHYARNLSAFLRAVGADGFVNYMAGDFLRGWPYYPTVAHVQCAAYAGALMNTREYEVGIAAAKQGISEVTEFRDDAGEVTYLLGALPIGSVSEIAGQLSAQTGKTVALVLLGTAGNEGQTVSVGVRGPNALRVAKLFGGGGHPFAAGWTVPWKRVAHAISAAVTNREEVDG